MKKHATVEEKAVKPLRQQAKKKTKLHFYLNLVFISLLLFLVTQLPISGSYTFSDLNIKQPLYKPAVLALPAPAVYPTKFIGLPDPQLAARAVMVVDIDSGKVLYQKNPFQKLYPASTTKLLTALVAVEYYNPLTILTSYRENVEGSKLGLRIGEQMQMRDLLKAVLVPSANDAALVLADNYPGGESAFVAKMNQKAKELHLESSQFKNPTGLHNPEHFTSARDLARLGTEAIKNATIKSIVRQKEVQVFDITKQQLLTVENVNQLLGIDGIDGIKTGYTQEAGGCLIATTDKTGHRLLSVVLDSSDRFTDTRNLLSFVLGSYRW